MNFCVIGYFSSGIHRIPHLESFLEAPVCKVNALTRARALTHIAGWGLKPTAERARDYARRKGIPYVALEDGFLRSLGLGVEGSLSHSLIVDYSGIYYDARTPCDLEGLIRDTTLTDLQRARAESGIALMRQYRLSKYNHAPDVWVEKDGNVARTRVLVVDQTLGDASVACGLADEQSFLSMLETALRDHPEADIWVKVHPDVIAGKKQGYLLEAARQANCRLISADVSPWALLDQVDDVYVVTSQMGFEALLAGKRVHCFGMPFYAGWGLTSDQLSSDRRGVPRSLADLFHAAYLVYCRYINPYTGERCDFEDTVTLIADQKRMCECYAGRWLALDFSGWKKRFIKRFLGSAASVEWGSSEKLPTSKQADNLLVWASKIQHKHAEYCHQQGMKFWRIEDGFVRSVGLGVDLVDPLSLVIDSRGIYYDARSPSDLEYYLQHADIPASIIERAARLRQRLVDFGVSKYNVGHSQVLDLPRDRHIILVPGQVETDASIQTGSLSIKTNAELLASVRAACPDAYIIYKPHPDVLANARIGALAGHADYDLEVRDVAMPDLLAQVDAVHTLTSLTGFEALLRDVPVTTWGLPFYAGWGLTQDNVACERRTRQRSVEELIAVAMLLYPVYVDPATGDQINAETALTLLLKQRRNPKPKLLGVKSRLWRLLRRRV